MTTPDSRAREAAQYLAALTAERDEYKRAMKQHMTRVSELKLSRAGFIQAVTDRDNIIGQSLTRITELTAERDAYAAAADTMAAEHKVERDALKDAARLALDALEKSTRYFNLVRLGESRLKDSEVRGDCHTAMNALKAVL